MNIVEYVILKQERAASSLKMLVGHKLGEGKNCKRQVKQSVDWPRLEVGTSRIQVLESSQTPLNIVGWAEAITSSKLGCVQQYSRHVQMFTRSVVLALLRYIDSHVNGAYLTWTSGRGFASRPNRQSHLLLTLVSSEFNVIPSLSRRKQFLPVSSINHTPMYPPHRLKTSQHFGYIWYL
jgi:hypothetical protein